MINGHPGTTPDLLCFSHLRWNFVFQRPQHLMTRCAGERRVYFIEEPIWDDSSSPRMHLEAVDGVTVVTPHVPHGLDAERLISTQRRLLDDLIDQEQITDFVAWYYTPMLLAFSDHLAPLATIYDCMDELSAFHGAPPALKAREAELMARADLMLTGGQSLYEAKRDQHRNIHPFPSSVDVTHFSRARRIVAEPRDQAPIARPRLGFFGVIDERMDLALLDGVAAARPDWQIVLLGPVVKIDPAVLPRRANIHYLGAKKYDELPQYLAGWDVALLPFARNEATRYISPTKTPEYMAAGKPVVSTSIRDVVRPYGQHGLVRIADTVDEFVAACVAAMAENASERVTQADAFLRQTSWDGTWLRISRLMNAVMRADDAEGDEGVVAV
ncbi:MAG TPA: glycosyltransferase family 1 protein [Vicinamibacterales bacterium]|nr:glycosyltransferase family 1 protein [Vicinamibacterales bacterium]